MHKRAVYAIQPYQVGSKQSKSLALVIPSKVAKEYHIDISTVFALRADGNTNKITLEAVKGIDEQKNVIPAEESFQASSQHVSSEAQ
jgi:hypothetical protein